MLQEERRELWVVKEVSWRWWACTDQDGIWIGGGPWGAGRERELNSQLMGCTNRIWPIG